MLRASLLSIFAVALCAPAALPQEQSRASLRWSVGIAKEAPDAGGPAEPGTYLLLGRQEELRINIGLGPFIGRRARAACAFRGWP
jgi:hypothetical protein